MHEMSVTQNLIRQVREVAQGQNISKIRAVRLRVGPLSGFMPEDLKFCFEVLTRGTEFEGAELDIELEPLVVHCKTCNKDTELETSEAWAIRCGQCQSNQEVQIVSGRSFVLKSLGVAED